MNRLSSYWNPNKLSLWHNIIENLDSYSIRKVKYDSQQLITPIESKETKPQSSIWSKRTWTKVNGQTFQVLLEQASWRPMLHRLGGKKDRNHCLMHVSVIYEKVQIRFLSNRRYSDIMMLAIIGIEVRNKNSNTETETVETMWKEWYQNGQKKNLHKIMHF